MIGMFDSGSGGLTILAGCRAALPGQSFLYLGDHARAPYGEKTPEEILEYTREMADALFRQDCRLVLLACNTASAVALRELQENWLAEAWPGRRLLGVLVPMVEALTGLPWDRDNPGIADQHPAGVGVFGTRRTVDSGSYSREIRRRAPDCPVVEQACPGLVRAIEGGASSDDLSALVGGFAGELISRVEKETGGAPEVALLGCTHYPLVEDLFRDALPAETKILSQPQVVARSLWAYLERHPEMAGESDNESLQLLTTGEPGSIINADHFMPASHRLPGSWKSLS